LYNRSPSLHCTIGTQILERCFLWSLSFNASIQP